MKMNREQAKKLGIDLPRSERAHWHAHKPTNGKAKPADPHALFDAACRSHGLPVALHEVAFHPTRRWKFDHLFEGWLAVEIEGGAFAGGRHTRGKGFRDDLEKYAEALILGYAVLRVLPEWVQSGRAFVLIGRALGAREEQP